MIAAFSTSSPWASVALLEGTGDVIWAGKELAPRSASAASMRLLERGLAETGRNVSDADLFAADLGPGSFTGVRVGVVLAKTLAWALHARCVGADSFDLVDPDALVVLPSKKGEYFVREPGAAPFRTNAVPQGAIGYGFEGAEDPPEAARFGRILSRLEPVAPEMLVPAYLIEASISQPKRPLSRLSP